MSCAQSTANTSIALESLVSVELHPAPQIRSGPIPKPDLTNVVKAARAHCSIYLSLSTHTGCMYVRITSLELVLAVLWNLSFDIRLRYFAESLM